MLKKIITAEVKPENLIPVEDAAQAKQALKEKTKIEKESANDSQVESKPTN